MNDKNFVVDGSTHSIMSTIKTLYSLYKESVKGKSEITDFRHINTRHDKPYIYIVCLSCLINEKNFQVMGIGIPKNKLVALENLACPKTQKEIQSVLGSLN